MRSLILLANFRRRVSSGKSIASKPKATKNESQMHKLAIISLVRSTPFKPQEKTRMTRHNSRLSKKAYEILLIHQGGVCAICKRTNPSCNGKPPYQLATDHSHFSNADRGLLCDRCNKLLGLAEDSPELLFRAILYLKEHDGIQFWGLSGNLDLKHSFETQGAGPNPQQGESNAREN